MFPEVPQAAGPNMPAVFRAPLETSSYWPAGTGTSHSGTSGDINQVRMVAMMVMVVVMVVMEARIHMLLTPALLCHNKQ